MSRAKDVELFGPDVEFILKQIEDRRKEGKGFETKERIYEPTDFVFKRELGQGSFGTVSLVHDNKANADLVVKKISKKLASLEEVNNEVAILKLLKPFCLEYLLCYTGFYDDVDNYYIISEYLDGYQTLNDFIASSPTLGDILLDIQMLRDELGESHPSEITALAMALEEKEGEAYDKALQIREIVCKLIAGLDVIHSLGIAHRDLKLLNIMLNPETKKIKYIDWGLACHLHGCDGYKLLGTAEFIPPELIVLRKDLKYNLQLYQKSDLWSLGMTIFELIKGQSMIKTVYPPPAAPFNSPEEINIILGYILDPQEFDIKFALGAEVYDYLEKYTPSVIQVLESTLIKGNPLAREIPESARQECRETAMLIY
jgi:serine/threonine protein kinase